MSYKDYIKEIPDFPIEGVNFKDISSLLAYYRTFRSAVVDMGRLVKNPNYWVGIDARGFIFASALATSFGGGVVMCRKAGKLPPPTEKATYALEYGTATLELQPGNGEVVIVYDVLASGGTLKAVNELAELAGYDVVGNLVLVDLKYVPRVDDFNLNVKSVVRYE